MGWTERAQRIFVDGVDFFDVGFLHADVAEELVENRLEVVLC